MACEKIGKVDLPRILDEIAYIDYSVQVLLQGIHKQQDPYKYTGKHSYHNQSNQERTLEILSEIKSFKNLKEFLFDIPYTNAIIEKYNLYYTRIITLQPGRLYSVHRDQTQRIHIPLITNEDNFFIIENKEYRLPADGSVYKVNTTLPHTFKNNSNQSRSHIVGLI